MSVRCANCGNPLDGDSFGHVCPVGAEAGRVGGDAPSRHRYVYRQDEETGEVYSVDIDSGWTGADRRAQTATEELVYGKVGIVAAGQNIDTKAKFNRYMKENGVCHASDYSAAHYEKKKAEREKFYTPGVGFDKKRRQEAIHRAVQMVESQGKLRRK